MVAYVHDLIFSNVRDRLRQPDRHLHLEGIHELAKAGFVLSELGDHELDIANFCSLV